MVFAHRTLLPDEQLTQAVSIRDIEGLCTSLAVAQGSNLHLINPFSKSLEITETLPFVSPILVIDSFESEKPSLFVLLKNMNWFIFELPDLKFNDTLYRVNPIPPTREIVHHGLFYAEQIPNALSHVTANINFNEKQIVHASHPDFIAVNVFNGVVHLISTKTKTDPFIINVLYPNVVSMTFIGPTLYSVRLAILTDSNGECRMVRVFKFYKNKSQFMLEHTISVPIDSHYLLPLQPKLQSTLAVFTKEGIVRINMPEDLPYSIENLSAFMPSIILHACYFYDDIYLLCDSSGGLIAIKLPVDGYLSTENMKITGPSSGIVVFDKEHFFVASPFGDSIAYKFIKNENNIQLIEFWRIQSSGPIFHLTWEENNLVCCSGRDNNSSVRIFEQLTSCEKLCQFNTDNCLSFFPACLTNDEFLLCLCFYNSTKIIKFNGSSISSVDWECIPLETETIIFSNYKDSIIHASNEFIQIIDKENGESSNKLTLDYKISAGALSTSNIILADDSKIIHIIQTDTFSELKKWKLNKIPLYLSATDDYVVTYLIDNKLLLFNISNPTVNQQISLPYFTVPISMEMLNENNIFLGTNDGNLFHISNSLSKITVKNYGNGKINLHKVVKNDSLICSGSPSFIIDDNGTHLLSVNQCEDICELSDNFICCINQNVATIYQMRKQLKYTTKVRQYIPNMLDMESFGVDSIICFIEDFKEPQKEFETSSNKVSQTKVNGAQSLVKYNNGKIESWYKTNDHYDISFFKVLEIPFDENESDNSSTSIIIIGDNQPSITLLDEHLNRVSWQKMLGVPLSACVYKSFLVIAREGFFDVFIVKYVDGDYEFERKTILDAHIMTFDFLVVNDFLIASDIQQALIVYNYDGSNFQKVAQDFSPKQITKLVYFENIIFAASITSAVYAYRINKLGSLVEIGSFQCNSQITSFFVHDNKLFYGSEGAGIGIFEPIKDGAKDLIALQSNFLKLSDLEIIADRKPPSTFTWNQPELFIDIDNLRVINNFPPDELTKLIHNSHTTHKRLMQFDIIDQ